MQIANLILQILPIAVSILAGVSTALAAVFNSQKKTAVSTMLNQAAALDSTHQDLRSHKTAVAELASKLPASPPGGNGFSDATKQILLNVPAPLTRNI